MVQVHLRRPLRTPTPTSKTLLTSMSTFRCWRPHGQAGLTTPPFVRARPRQPTQDRPAVERALDLLDRPAYQAVLIGGSVTDLQVSLAIGIRSIGFAKTPIRGRELQYAGADAIADAVAALADLIRQSGRAA